MRHLALAGAVTMAASQAVLADAFVNVRMEAETSPGVWSSSVAGVTAGQVINYRITAQLAAPTVVNTSSSNPFPLNTPATATDGINAARFNIFQLASDGVQANFLTAPTLSAAWAAGADTTSTPTGVGFSSGTTVARGNGFNDVAGVKAVGLIDGINDPYAGRGATAAATVATGSFTIGSVAPSAAPGTIQLTYRDSAAVGAGSTFTAQDPGSFKYTTIFGGTATPVTQVALSTNSDPMYSFVGLTLDPTAAGPVFIKGDFSGDGVFDFTDIDPFVTALLEGPPFGQYIADNNAAFMATYGQSITEEAINALGDFSGDGVTDFTDIDPFVNTLLGGGSTPEAVALSASIRAAAAVPEPATMSLLFAVPAMFLGRRRR